MDPYKAFHVSSYQRSLIVCCLAQRYSVRLEGMAMMSYVIKSQRQLE